MARTAFACVMRLGMTTFAGVARRKVRRAIVHRRHHPFVAIGACDPLQEMRTMFERLADTVLRANSKDPSARAQHKRENKKGARTKNGAEQCAETCRMQAHGFSHAYDSLASTLSSAWFTLVDAASAAAEKVIRSPRYDKATRPHGRRLPAYRPVSR